MDKHKQTIGLLLVIGAVAFTGAFIGGKRPAIVERVVEKTFGASPGPTHYDTQEFIGGYTYGGYTCAATSTTAAVGTLQATGDTTLTLPETSCIDFTVNVADVTLTLAASTTGWYPVGVGVSKQLLIRNASTTASADIILAAGTGINIKGVSTSTDSTVTFKTILGDTGADNYAIINFVRQSDTDINAHITTFSD